MVTTSVEFSLLPGPGAGGSIPEVKPVIFYLPAHHWPEAHRLEEWMGGIPRHVLPEGKAATLESWILRTWAELRRRGLPVELASEFPAQGTVVALTGNLPASFQCPAGVFLVGVAADGLSHPAASLHVLQNPAHARRLSRAVAIPHWPQPGLVPRPAERGETFEHADFFGDPRNLAPELRDPGWQDKLLREAGMRLRLRPAPEWSDYSSTDCALGIRDFEGRPHLNKPASKLINAWLAGVPFVGGLESSFQAEGKPGVDCLLCGSPEEVLEALLLLKSNPGLRSEIVEAGRARARAFTEDAIAERWRQVLWEQVPEAAASWKKKPPALQAALRMARKWQTAWDHLHLR